MRSHPIVRRPGWFLAAALLVPTSVARSANVPPDWLVAPSARYATIQDAINALSPDTGGVVYVPAGLHYQSHALVFPAKTPVRLVGAGINATNLLWASPANADSAYVTIRGAHQAIENLQILGNRSKSRAVGVRFAPTTPFISGCELRNVSIQGTPSWCVEALASSTQHVRVEGCEFNVNDHDGLVKLDKYCTTWSFRDCNFGSTNHGPLLDVDECTAIHVTACSFETETDIQPLVTFDKAISSSLLQCYFEIHGASRRQPFIQINGTNNLGITIANCYFARAAPVSKLVEVERAGTTYGLNIINPVVNIPTSSDSAAVVVRSPTVKGARSSTMTVVGGVQFLNRAGGIEPVSDPSSDSSSTNAPSRVRLPRLTERERDALPDKKIGDIIYCTSGTSANRVQVWTGRAWVNL